MILITYSSVVETFAIPDLFALIYGGELEMVGKQYRAFQKF